jgi:hypothetical protein
MSGPWLRCNGWRSAKEGGFIRRREAYAMGTGTDGPRAKAPATASFLNALLWTRTEARSRDRRGTRRAVAQMRIFMMVTGHAPLVGRRAIDAARLQM